MEIAIAAPEPEDLDRGPRIARRLALGAGGHQWHHGALQREQRARGKALGKGAGQRVFLDCGRGCRIGQVFA